MYIYNTMYYFYKCNINRETDPGSIGVVVIGKKKQLKFYIV